MNVVCLSGRLTQDPSIRILKTGKMLSSFTLAINRTVNEKEQTDFVDCLAWDKLAEKVKNHAAKGRLMVLFGRLSVHKYENRSGRMIKAAEVVASAIELIQETPKTSGTKKDDFGQAVNYDIPF